MVKEAGKLYEQVFEQAKQRGFRCDFIEMSDKGRCYKVEEVTAPVQV
jgi:hypothetical protein